MRTGHGAQKTGATILLLTNFQNSFSVRLSNKCAVNSSL